jgi:hypothetical protein
MRKITTPVLCLTVLASFLSAACHALTAEELEQIKQTIRGETKEINDRISGLDERLRKLEERDNGYSGYVDGEYPPSHPVYSDGASRHIYIHKTVRHIHEHRSVHCCRPILGRRSLLVAMVGEPNNPLVRLSGSLAVPQNDWSR